MERTPRAYAFGPYRLEPEERILLRDGGRVTLPPKAFEVLVVLVENAGRLVTKEELLRRVWADVFVTEANLTQNISLLRAALGESGQDSQTIETVRGSGYRFHAVVRESGAEPASAGAVTTADAPGASVLEALPRANTSGRFDVGLGTRGLAFAVGLAVLLMLALGAMWSHPDEPTERRGETARPVALTRLGTVKGAVVAPDAGRVIYAVAAEGGTSLWQLDPKSGRHEAIGDLPQVAVVLQEMAADGRSIDFVAVDRLNSRDLGLYRFDLDARRVTVLRRGIAAPLDVSRDGHRVLFVDDDLARGHSRLMLGPVEGGEARVLAERPLDDPFSAPAFGADESTALVTVGPNDGRGPTTGLLELDAEGGAERWLLPRVWGHLAAKRALPRGGIVFIGRHASGANRLWRIASPERPTETRASNVLTAFSRRPSPIAGPGDVGVEALSDDGAFWSGVSVDDAGAAVVSVVSRHAGTLWSVDAGGEARALGGAQSEPCLLADGGIVFVGEDQQLWHVDAEGKTRRQLTHEGTNQHPTATPDGKSIVFASDRGGRTNLWRLDLEVDGGKPRQPVRVTAGAGEDYPEFSPDGRFLYSTALPEERVWRRPWPVGDPELVSELRAWRIRLSPDGRRAALSLVEEPERPSRIAILALDGSAREAAPPRFVDLPPAAEPGRGFRFAPDGVSLFVGARDAGGSNVVEVAIDRPSGLVVPRWANENLFGFDLVKVGPGPREVRWVAARGAWRGDVVRLALADPVSDD
jgi:DNA-binding winged helix-turn-helix (wHTH) protein